VYDDQNLCLGMFHQIYYYLQQQPTEMNYKIIILSTRLTYLYVNTKYKPTHETTRPLKHGNGESSSTISSLTTLKYNSRKIQYNNYIILKKNKLYK